MYKSDTVDAATGKPAFRPRENLPPAGQSSVAPAAPAARGGLKADDLVGYARQVWQRDRNLAARHLYDALRIDPGHAQANNMLAGYFYHSGMIDEALPYSAKAVVAAPNDLDIVTDHTLVLDTLGRTDEALNLIQRHLGAGRLTPELVLRSASLSEKCDGSSDGGGREEALDLIRRALSMPALDPLQRKSLHFYASKLLDQMKRYDEAFEQARLMHAVAPVDFDPHAFRAQVAEHAAWFSAERLQTLPKATHGWSQPVFIVGMPRSGTTLVEQILDRHPEVFGAGELIDFARVVEQAARKGGRRRAYDGFGYGGSTGWLADVTQDHLDALAGLYLSRVTSFAPRSRYITDKLPSNWMHLGLISRLFPQAHVIHVVRDPLDTCLSCYLTHFHDALAYSMNLTHLGMQYVDQRNLMTHWREVLDLPILQVSYEALVADPENQVRRLLSFLELPWDERCLSFHQNPRVANTASVNQVRRPMYSSSVGRWKRYAAHLGPLVEALNEPNPTGGAPDTPVHDSATC